MPLQQLKFAPGINREQTSLSGEGGWFDCDKIRFRAGFPEKIGGWKPISSATFDGTCRSLWNWISLNGFDLMGVGTELKFYIEYGNVYYDITPIRRTVTLNNPFATTYDSTLIVVTDVGHGAITGDYVVFSGATTVAGLNLNFEYQITYVDSNTYTITSSTPANATVAAGGGASVVAEYQINNGTNVGTTQTGWGAGLWGGVITGSALTQLNGAINNSVTTIVADSTSGFPSTNGLILIDDELISYTGPNTGTNFVGCTRGALGTTATSHLNNALTYNATNYYGWGQSGSTATNTALRLWSQSNYGEDLLFSWRGGPLYYWSPGDGPSPALSMRATIVTATNVPVVLNQVMVSDISRITIAFGCNDLETVDPLKILDPLLIRWSAVEDYLDWTPTATNQAGGRRLSHGSRIVGAIQSREEILVWTDSAIYSMQYIGYPSVYKFTLLSDNISIISPNCMVTATGVVFWMGIDKFYVYSGRVDTLPSTLRKYIYQDINLDQSEQVFGGTNEGFSEIWWFYCSTGSPVINRYVIFNYLDKVWYYGTMSRTAWLDSSLNTYPMAATLTNQIVEHESIVDDGTTNPASPISAYIQSSDFDLGDGHNNAFVWRMLPDVTFDGSTTPSPLKPQIRMSMRPKKNPGAAFSATNNPTVASAQSYASQRVYNVQEFTQVIYTRARGREMAIRIESDTIGTQWQLGTPRMDIRQDGKR
jgi:hypothetical protein